MERLCIEKYILWNLGRCGAQPRIGGRRVFAAETCVSHVSDQIAPQGACPLLLIRSRDAEHFGNAGNAFENLVDAGHTQTLHAKTDSFGLEFGG